MSTPNENRAAIEATRGKALFAIFYREGRRYAIRNVGVNLYHSFAENAGKWEKCASLVTWCIWNTELQGHDDITSLIVE